MPTLSCGRELLCDDHRDFLVREEASPDERLRDPFGAHFARWTCVDWYRTKIDFLNPDRAVSEKQAARRPGSFCLLTGYPSLKDIEVCC
jgi:hypothetical protein